MIDENKFIVFKGLHKPNELRNIWWTSETGRENIFDNNKTSLLVTVFDLPHKIIFCYIALKDI